MQIQVPTFIKKFLPAQSSKSSGPETSLACDFGRSKIAFVEIEKTPAGTRLLKFQKTTRPMEKERDAEILRQAYEAGEYKSKKVKIAVKGQGVIVRFIQFPHMKESELRSAISYELDQYIPFKAPEVVWDIVIIDDNIQTSGGGQGMSLMLVAVKRDELYPIIQTFQAAGLEIELVDVDALAIINAFEFFHPEEIKTTSAFLDIGADTSTLSIVQGSKPRFCRDVSFGGNDLIKRLRRKLGLSEEEAAKQIEVDEAPSPEAAAVIKETLADLVSELRISFNYFLDQVSSADAVKKLFIGGGGAYHPLVMEMLSNALLIPVETLDVLSHVELGPGVDAQFVRKNQGLLPVVLGLAVRDL